LALKKIPPIPVALFICASATWRKTKPNALTPGEPSLTDPLTPTFRLQQTAHAKHATADVRDRAPGPTEPGNPRSRSEDIKPVTKRAGGNDSQRCPTYSSIE
jgi:hypothetical protein